MADTKVSVVCRNCGKPIEKILDPWGYSSHQGLEYGWHHPHLTDESDGEYRMWCLESEMFDDAEGDEAEGDEAEPYER